MRVQDVMTSDVVTARPEMTLKEAARELSARGISGMPVVDDELHVLGVISEADLLGKERHEPESNGGALSRLRHRGISDDQRRFGALDVGAAMTAPAVTVEAYCPLAGAAERMLALGINRLPAVRRGRLVAGVVEVRSELTSSE
jgi:CBS domain-containing protein